MIDMLLIVLLILTLGLAWWTTERLRVVHRSAQRIATHQEQMKARGIYVITCSGDSGSYLGSTKINFHIRWGQHIAALTRGQHNNLRLQSAWDIHGPGSFAFSVLEVIDDVSTIETRERELLEYRSMNILPAANYNVSNSRVYPAAVVPELNPVPVMAVRHRRRAARPTMTAEEQYLILSEARMLGLDDDEIASIASRVVIRDGETGEIIKWAPERSDSAIE